MSDLLTRRDGQAGRITLNRPQALNALSWEMGLGIEAALLDWKDDAEIALVVIDAAGDRAFGAGGDIKQLWEKGQEGDFAYGRRFWADEYRMNALLANYGKPIVSLVDGIVMGGGVGVASHCAHRVVSEKTLLAMPECGIGLIPDVGGTWLLGHAPGGFGEYLGLTGARIGARDAILTGFADIFIPSENLPRAAAALCGTGEVAALEAFAADPSDAAEPAVAPFLEALHDDIADSFAADDPHAILAALERRREAWAQAAAEAIRKACPISIACTLMAIRAARNLSRLEEALAREFRFTYRSQEEGELQEGIRAAVVDKDRNPQWRMTLEEVWPERAAAMLASLGDSELQL